MSTKSKNNVLAIFGPTASGKTDLLKKLFVDTGLSSRVSVISADSIQVFRGLDVGSAKPDAGFLSTLPHKLIDIIEPDKDFSVGDFVRLADEACRECVSQGRLPVISGGTAYYLRGFIMGIPETPQISGEIRVEVLEELRIRGPESLRAELLRVDPESHARIHANDTYRLTRALEVFRGTGRPLSSFPVPDRPREDWNVLAIGLERPRDELNERIRERVELMFEKGLAAEVLGLLGQGYTKGSPGLKGIGYAEFIEAYTQYGADFMKHQEILDEVREAIILHTRQYAKRQMTFMRSLPGVQWFAPDSVEAIKKAIDVALAPDFLFGYTSPHDA